MGEIYKITNKSTGKIYIGKTKRKTRDRWLEHIRDSKNYPFKNIPLHKAIIKHGKDNFLVETIENNVSDEEINDKEKYYIKKFNSTNSSIGYNATTGGDGGVVSAKLSLSDVSKIKEILSDNSNTMSFREIGELFNVTFTAIKSINNGESWYDDKTKYPIRKYDITTLGISKEKYKNIVRELIKSDLQLQEIADKYDVSVQCICSINQGKYCYNGKNLYYKGIYYGSFPIRKTNKKVNCDFNVAFYEVLFTNKSISQIERDFDIHFNGLRYIVLGKRRKELTKDYILPMRGHIEENQIIWNKLNGVYNNEICTNS